MSPTDTSQRLTVTVPADLYREVEARLAGAAGGNRSRFVADALRTHLRHLRLQDLTDEAAKLDPEEELTWVAPHPTPTA